MLPGDVNFWKSFRKSFKLGCELSVLDGRRWVFHGHVQGVGFRVTTCRLATAFPVRGYVRNQDDGTVEVVCWGDPTTLDAFEAAILREHGSLIRYHSTTVLQNTGPIPDSFTIQY